MGLLFCSFASGSSGNSYLVKSDSTALLIDVGISCKSIEQSLNSFDLKLEDISAILITHEHSDHVKSLRTLNKKAENIPIYATPGTFNFIIERIIPSLESDDINAVIPDTGSFMIGDIKVTPFPTSHDAKEPVGYTFTDGEGTVAILTDTGYVTDKAFDAIQEADILILEANHEKNMLLVGKYPYYLKQRIMGKYGHLSNEDAANCLIKILKKRKNHVPPRVILAHLSSENNTPDIAEITIKNMLYEKDLLEGRDYYLSIAPRSEPSSFLTSI